MSVTSSERDPARDRLQVVLSEDEAVYGHRIWAPPIQTDGVWHLQRGWLTELEDAFQVRQPDARTASPGSG